MEFDSEKMQRFDKAISKLIQNRQNVPLEVLQTKYKESWTALMREIRDYSEWYADHCLAILTIPTNPKDAAGNEWLRRTISRIKAEEHKPGGIYQRIRDALILTLDWNALGKAIYPLYLRIEKEAWNPYQRRYNKEVGGRIWNGLFRAWWKDDQTDPDGGYWIDEKGQLRMRGFSPRAGGQDGKTAA